MAQRRYAVCDGCGREQVLTNDQKLRGWWTLAPDVRQELRTAASPDRPSAGPFEFCSLACVKQFVEMQPEEQLV